MTRWVSTAVAALMIAGTAARVSADSITITADGRTTIVLAHTSDANGRDRHTDTDGPGDAFSSTATATTGTSSGVSGAALVSSVSDPMHLSGTGTADVSWATQDFADYSAYSAYAVTFALTSAVNFVFNGSFDGSYSNSGASLVSSGQSRWSAGLVRDGGGGTLFSDSGINSTASRLFTGLLMPGTYRLLVDAGSTGVNNRDGGAGATHTEFDFSLDLTAAEAPPSPTPEPTSLLLLGTGVLALLRARRSRT